MSIRDNVRVCVPRYLQIGKGSLGQLPEIIKILGSINSLLIVTDKQILVVDDIADTGETLKDFQNKHNVICTFHYHEQSIVKPDFYCEEKGDKWIVYPWETEDSDEIQDYLKEENVNE